MKASEKQKLPLNLPQTPHMRNITEGKMVILDKKATEIFYLNNHSTKVFPSSSCFLSLN